MSRLLIVLGLVLVALGLTWPRASRLGPGHLPGDIAVKAGHGGFYFPIVTCLLVSAVLSLIVWLLGR